MAVDTKKYLNTEGLSHFWDKIKTYVGEAVESKPSDIHFVVPNEKEATEALTATVSDINALSPGLAIALRMPFDNVASQTLNINSLGAKPIYYQSNNTDAGKFPSGAVVFLVYETTSIATGCFKAVYSYDGAQPSIYQGATASAAGTAGLVPSAASFEREKFLCGDGTWKEVSTAKEVGYVSSEPSIQNTEVLDNESFIFYETGQANSSILINASITGNADTASSLNHALTLRFNNETDEGNSQYTFNGSSAKEIDFAAGTGISLTASQGTVTIAGNAYQGATDASNGVAGLVPPATISEKDKYLKGDGTWGTVADTKVNAILAATTKAYLLGTSTTPTSSAKAVTAIADTAVYLDTTAGRLTAGSFAGNGENITLGTASAVVVTDANKKLVASTTVSATELGYLDGVTSSIQTQLNGKAASSHNHDASNINSGTLDVARIPSLDASKIASGTIDIARLPSGALPILKVVGNETERFALTSSDVQVGDTVQQTDTGLMYYVKDTSKLNSENGYAVYTAGAATSVPWSGVTDKPGTYAPSAHNQASNTINAMTGYSKPSSTSAIGTSDTLNAAIGKLEKALDGKAASSHGTHVTYSTSNPLVAGTASAGTANNVSRGDHVHPEQTVVKQTRGVFLVIPNETTQTATLTATVDGITEYFPGLMVAYRAPFNTAANTTLNINSLGAKPIYYGVNTTSKDYYPANRLVLLVYETTTTSGGCWKMVYSFDGNSNNYDRRLHNNAVKAAAAVTAGTVIVGTSAGYKTAASGVTFDIQYPVLYASAAIASAATATNTYEAIPSVNLQTTKASWTGTQYSVVYLVGTLSGTTVTIDSSIFTTTIPSSADGKVYIPIGVLYSTYQVYFAPTRDIYQYTNGSFHPLDTTTAATGGSNGTIKINGTDVAVKGLGSAAYTASTAYLTPSSTLDATKLSGTIPSGCYTTYTHPTTSGNKHIPSGGSSGQFLGWSADGTAAWVNNPNWTTHLYAGAASNATANATSATTNAATYIVVCDNSTARNAVQVTGTNGTTVSAVNGKLIIDSPALASVTNAQIDTLFA